MDKVPKNIKSSVLEYSFSDLTHLIEQQKVKHIWFTGGEPTVQAKAIVNYLDSEHRKFGKCYHICTAGWIWDRDLFDLLSCITVDVKPPSSKTKSNIEVLARLSSKEYSHKTEFKMVVANTDEDREFAKSMINKYEFMDWTLQPLYVSQPEALEMDKPKVDASEWQFNHFAGWINNTFRDKANVRMGFQLHKHIWPDRMMGI